MRADRAIAKREGRLTEREAKAAAKLAEAETRAAARVKASPKAEPQKRGFTMPSDDKDWIPF
jgi:hypothetical protein